MSSLTPDDRTSSGITDLSRSFSEQKSQAWLPLNTKALKDLKSRMDVPSYARDKSKAGTIHFGWGGFSGAHLGAIHHELLKQGIEDAGIIAVIPRLRINQATGKCDALTRADALRNQDFLYTVRERDLTTDKTYVCGSLMDIMVGPHDREAVYERMAAKETKLITGTVTQKGYEWDIDKGSQADRDEEKLDQFANYITEALALRFQRGMEPFAIMSCDNVEQNGNTLKDLVGYFAREKHIPGFAEWVIEKAVFYNTMVDRITPSITDHSREEMRNIFGLVDDQPIATETYRELVIGVGGHIPEPPFPYKELTGAQYTPNVILHEKAKIGMLNGTHMATGVFGRLRGEHYIEEALKLSSIFNDASGYMSQIRNTLQPVPDRDLDAYGPTLMERFQNPHPHDLLRRLARNGVSKVKERFFDPLRVAYTRGLEADKIVSAIAHWVVYLGKANDNPATEEDVDGSFFIEDQKAYDQGIVGVAKSCNGSVSPVFVLPMFAQMARDFPQFRQDLQEAYVQIVHPANSNLPQPQPDANTSFQPK